jgi:dihydrodipicolinate synthase/N-acetylneuraminate lyase
VDLESFERQVAIAVHDGADGLAMFGLASEYYKLTDDERRGLINRLIRTVAERVPVILSVTHHATEIAVRQAREAQDSGAAAIMILPPFFLDPPHEAIVEHVACVAGAVDIPAILQYAPAQTGTGEEILSCTPVSIVKIDAVPFAPAAKLVPERCLRLAGYMGLDLPDAVTAGCQGVMPTASLVPQFRRLWDGLHRDPEEGRRFHQHLAPVLQFMMRSIEFLVACEKHLLVRRNAISDPNSRRPRTILDPSEIATLNQYFNTL